MHHISLGSFLEGLDGGTLPPQRVRPNHIHCMRDIVRDLADESGEGQFADEEVGAFLEFADFPESEGPRAVSAATGNGEGVAGRYSADAATTGGGFATGGFATGGFPPAFVPDDCFSAGWCSASRWAGHCGMAG